MSDVVPANSSAVPAVPDDDLMVGLEDFAPEDYTLPRLKLDHKAGRIVDTLSNEAYESLEVIMLGLNKKRILWGPEVREDAVPLCKSYDAIVGHPDPKNFPWQASGFNANDVYEAQGKEPVLTCADCVLKEWGTHPKQDKSPWCGMQYALVVMQPVANGWAPALFEIQRSALKNANAYMTSFARAQQPLFTVMTQITLQQLKRGSNEYVIPQFVKKGATTKEDWPEFAKTFRMVREQVQTPPTKDEEAAQPAAGPTDNTHIESDDEIPF